MKISDGVEWSVHCCTLLASLSDGQTLPAAKLAEFHEVPPAYLAKALQALTAAGITTSQPGPRGGYRLARPASEIRLLDIVLAIDGDETAFRCSEIRQNGPAAAEPDSPAYRKACGIARAMWRAEDAWRRELAAVTVADLVDEILVTVPPTQLLKGWEWIQQVQLRPRSRSHSTTSATSTNPSGATNGSRLATALSPQPPAEPSGQPDDLDEPPHIPAATPTTTAPTDTTERNPG